MKYFSEWFINIFKVYLKDLGQMLKNIFVGLYNFFIGKTIYYAKDFFASSKNFKPLDWLIAIPSLLIILMLFVVLAVLLIQILRRYIRFVKKEYEKDELMHEIALLNYRISELTDEKNAALSLSGGGGFLDKSENGQNNRQAKSKKEVVAHNRFVKLIDVDEKYRQEICLLQ